MDDKIVKLLLIEPDPHDAMLLKEALMEIEERQHGRVWSPSFEPIHVERLGDALDVIAEERFDAALLDVVLPDSHSLHAFLRLQAVAPEMSILMLADKDDEALAISAVREGAQDYLVKSELDCAPLARALRHAIERQRIAAATRSEAFQDRETGFYNESSFRTLAERDFRLARKLGCDLRLHYLQLNELERIQASYGKSEEGLAVMEAAEIIRQSCRENDLIGRLDPKSFAIASLDRGPQDPRGSRELRRRMRGMGASVAFGSMRETGARDLEALLRVLSEPVCENKRSGMDHPAAV
jgi:two-component system, cell cycle response regulator